MYKIITLGMFAIVVVPTTGKHTEPNAYSDTSPYAPSQDPIEPVVRDLEAPWILENGCLGLEMSAELIVANADTTADHKNISVPNSASILTNASSCSVVTSADTSQVISLYWNYQKSTDIHLARNISLQFSRSNDSTSDTLYGISKMTAMVEMILDHEDKNSTGGLRQFVKMTTGEISPVLLQSPLNRSMVCHDTVALEMTSKLLSFDGSTFKNLQTSFVVFKYIHFDAFRPDNISRTEFQASIICDLAKYNDLLPVLVGGGLAGIVLFIVVGYLMGRGRAVVPKGKGYSSV